MKNIELLRSNLLEYKKILVENLKEAFENDEPCLLTQRENDEVLEVILIPNKPAFSSLIEILEKDPNCIEADFLWDDHELDAQLGLCAMQCAFSRGIQKFLLGETFMMVGKEYYEEMI